MTFIENILELLSAGHGALTPDEVSLVEDTIKITVAELGRRDLIGPVSATREERRLKLVTD